MLTISSLLPVSLDLNDKLRTFFFLNEKNRVCLDFSRKPAFLSPIQAHLECHCFLQPCVGQFFTSLSLSPPLKVLHSVNIPMSFTSLLLPLGRADCLSSVKGIGRKESFQTPPAGLPWRPRCVWEVLHQATLLSCFTRGGGLWPWDPVPHFGYLLEKKPLFLLVNLCSEDQTLNLNSEGG